MPAVADTGPINYLILTEQIEWLPAIYASVLVPEQVAAELSDERAPPPVLTWIASPPAWLSIRPVSALQLQDVDSRLGSGERAALALAAGTKAEALLVDDRAGAAAASRLGLRSVGTLGLMIRAAQLGLTDLRDAFARLDATGFQWTAALRDRLLAEYAPPR